MVVRASFSITISQLAVQFGCMSMAEFAEQRLQEYKEKMGLDKQVDAGVIGAVFYLCARRSKVSSSFSSRASTLCFRTQFVA